MSDFPCCANGEHHRVQVAGTTGDVLERAAEVLCDSSARGTRWSDLKTPLRAVYHRRARNLNAAGLLAHPADPETAARARTLVDQYAAEDPFDGDAGSHFRRGHAAGEALDALRAVIGLDGAVDKCIVRALLKADRTPVTELRIVIDADCPGCKWGERWFSPVRELFGCSKCAYTSTERNA